MKWDKETFKEARIAAKFSQQTLANKLGVHWRTIQNWEKGITSIPTSAIALIDKVFGYNNDMVSIEEYNKVVEALNSATELNKKLTDLLQSNTYSPNPKE